MIKKILVYLLCVVLVGCNNEQQIELSKLLRNFKSLNDEQIQQLSENGHLSAINKQIQRYCYSMSTSAEDCLKKRLMHVNNGGVESIHGLALDYLPLSDTELKSYKSRYEAYVWLRVHQYFYLIDREPNPMSIQQKNAITTEFTDQQLVEAETEALVRATKIATSLEKYCKDTVHPDYICYYRLGKPQPLRDLDDVRRSGEPNPIFTIILILLGAA